MAQTASPHANGAASPSSPAAPPSHGLPAGYPDMFLVPDFDPDGCISDLRRYVPLSTLKHELDTYLSNLKNKLVEVINEDYGDYVSLSSRLVNVDGSVIRMRRPLTELKEKLLQVQEAVKAELATLNQGLRRRKEVASARATLELLQEVAHVASKVEKLLEEMEAGLAVGQGDLDGSSRMLERVAGEVSRLSFLAARGKDLAFVKNMESRIASARQVLDSHLQGVFSEALAARHWTAVSHCLHAYMELGDGSSAEAAVRQVLVAPAVKKIVAEHKAAHPVAAGKDLLAQLLQQLLSALQQECRPILDATLPPESGLHIFNFLGNSLLAEVAVALADSLPGVFSPGVPTAFHAHFLAATAFLQQLEGMCQTRATLERLRACPAYSAYLKKWNLAVYFSLLYQDIAGELEDAAQADRLVPLEAPQERGLGLQLAVSGALWRCLQRCHSPETFLPQITDKFLKLALQLCSRYSSWLATVAQIRREAPQQQAQQQQQQQQAQQQSPGQPGQPGQPQGASPGQQGQQGGGASTNGAAGQQGGLLWPASVTAEDLALIFNDAEVLAVLVAEQFTKACAEVLQAALPEEAMQAVTSALQGAGRSLSDTGGLLLDLVVDETAERCVAVVRQLKGITATYRMTSKGPPTRHSHYVTGALAPLKAFLDAEKVRRLSEEARRRLVAGVADLVCTRYQSLAEDLLTAVRKTESSLKRLKRNRPGEAEGGADAGGMTDSDKITLQLHLDVMEFGRQLERFGLQGEQLPAFGRLLESVTPGQGVAQQAAE